MSKFGNKGFMMAEVVVVSVIVAVTLVTLYTSVNRLTTAFNLRNKYHDLDCLNLSMAVDDELIGNGKINTLMNGDDSFKEISDDVNNIKSLYDDYDWIEVYFLKNGTTIDDNIKEKIYNNTAKDYFTYLQKNYDNKYNYYIVSELCKIGADDCYYYGLGVR